MTCLIGFHIKSSTIKRSVKNSIYCSHTYRVVWFSDLLSLPDKSTGRVSERCSRYAFVNQGCQVRDLINSILEFWHCFVRLPCSLYFFPLRANKYVFVFSLKPLNNNDFLHHRDHSVHIERACQLHGAIMAWHGLLDMG